MLRHITVKGDHYSCGKQLGKILKKEIQRRLQQLSPVYSPKKYKNGLEKINKICSKYHPDLMKQLKGIAEGAEVDYWHLLFMNAPEFTEKTSGCTSIARVENYNAELFHNEDGVGQERIKECALVTYKYRNITITSFTYPGELPGESYNWNSHGLYFSVNYIVPVNPLPFRYPPRRFTACALTKAKNIKDAIRILKSSPDASGFHYYVGYKKEIYSIEQLNSKLSIRKIKGINIHTNHYIHPKFSKKTEIYKDSKIRLIRGEKLIEEKINPLSILTDRKTTPNSICAKSNEGSITLSTVHFSPKENEVTIYQPGNLKVLYKFKLK